MAKPTAKRATAAKKPAAKKPGAKKTSPAPAKKAEKAAAEKSSRGGRQPGVKNKPKPADVELFQQYMGELQKLKNTEEARIVHNAKVVNKLEKARSNPDSWWNCHTDEDNDKRERCLVDLRKAKAAVMKGHEKINALEEKLGQPKTVFDPVLEFNTCLSHESSDDARCEEEEEEEESDDETALTKSKQYQMFLEFQKQQKDKISKRQANSPPPASPPAATPPAAAPPTPANALAALRRNVAARAPSVAKNSYDDTVPKHDIDSLTKFYDESSIGDFVNIPENRYWITDPHFPIENAPRRVATPDGTEAEVMTLRLVPHSALHGTPAPASGGQQWVNLALWNMCWPTNRWPNQTMPSADTPMKVAGKFRVYRYNGKPILNMIVKNALPAFFEPL